MNKVQLTRQLTLLHKDLLKAASRANKISVALNIGSNEDINNALSDVEALLELTKDDSDASN